MSATTFCAEEMLPVKNLAALQHDGRGLEEFHNAYHCISVTH